MIRALDFRSIESCVKLCNELGLDFIELNMNLPLGTGEINISERLHLARVHNCRVVLEIKTIDGLKQSVKTLTNYLY